MAVVPGLTRDRWPLGEPLSGSQDDEGRLDLHWDCGDRYENRALIMQNRCTVPGIRQKSLMPLILCISFWIASCSESNKKDEIAETCFEIVDGERYFIGSRDCMEPLTISIFDGYFVSNLEYSVFYRSISEINVNFDNKAHWLSMSPYAEGQIRNYQLGGMQRVFEVKFEGSMSDVKGFYGQGTFSKGVHVRKFINIRELNK